MRISDWSSDVCSSDLGELRLPADAVLVTVGRRPLTEGWGREELALDMNGPFVAVDETCRTSMRGIWAIGDVTGAPMLAHRAIAPGEMVAEVEIGTASSGGEGWRYVWGRGVAGTIK